MFTVIIFFHKNYPNKERLMLGGKVCHSSNYSEVMLIRKHVIIVCYKIRNARITTYVVTVHAINYTFEFTHFKR